MYLKFQTYSSYQIYKFVSVCLNCLFMSSQTHLLREQADEIELQDASSSGIYFPSSNKLDHLAVGIPVQKGTFSYLDIFSASTSLLCLIGAFVAVFNDWASWHLSRDNNQLIVLGFLLAIMSLCLKSTTTTLFLILEAKFGRSKLQNYDGIIRNSIFTDRLGYHWRFILALMFALPLGLSVAYKLFNGGQSSLQISVADFTGNISQYGMFAPPRVLAVGLGSGIAVFANATLPFATRTNLTRTQPGYARDPGNVATSMFVNQAYGHNILLLDQNNSAALDMPHPKYVTKIQALLTDGEYWSLSADVLGTVASFDTTNETDPKSYNNSFMADCTFATDRSKTTLAYAYQVLLRNNTAIWHITRPSPGNQSIQHFAVTIDREDQNEDPKLLCKRLYPTAVQYNVHRRQCHGTWTIRRNSIELAAGSCNATNLEAKKQLVFTDSSPFLPAFFGPTLVELVGPLMRKPGEGRDPLWLRPYYATATATMLWARITSLCSVTDENTNRDNCYTIHPASKNNRTAAEVGLVYTTNEVVNYVRPTAQKSPLLAVILAIQPLMLLVFVVVIAVLSSTPIHRSFGMTAVLAGIRKEDLDRLSGASLSGRTSKDLWLTISPNEGDLSGGRIDYRLTNEAEQVVRKKLKKGVIYH